MDTRRISISTVLLLGVTFITGTGDAFAQTHRERKPAEVEAEPYVPDSELHGHHEMGALEDGELLAPGTAGKWDLLDPATMPINPVHLALMHNGKVLVIAGSGNVENNSDRLAVVWDPVRKVASPVAMGWDMFCNGMVVLPDGRPFVFGGTLAYATDGRRDWKGLKNASLYTPGATAFVDARPMQHGRWYPTGTVLGDGRVMVFSGNNEYGGIGKTVEIYHPGTNTWTAGRLPPAAFVPSWYPRQHLLPSGKVFVAGWQPQSYLYDPAGPGQWFNGPVTILNQPRVYGTSVLLPLMPEDGYRARVMILGGNPGVVQSSTEIIDVSRDTPAEWTWTQGPDMASPRVQLNATILPNGQVFVSGGSASPGGANPVYRAELYTPGTGPGAFRAAARATCNRRYHSNTLLLPDATVLAVGDNTTPIWERRIEIYSPPYLFNGTARPAISSAPANVTYGSTFVVGTPDAASIRKVVLIRPGAPTHAFDMEQRLVGMSFMAGAGVLNVTAPPNGNLAPPGYYMLFILKGNGTPSVAKFVKLQ